MLTLNNDGLIIQEARILVRRAVQIERGPLVKVTGIIVHQTGSSNELSVFSSYKASNANGAHFLIAKNGTIYQTASLLKQTRHVGALKSRCLMEHKCKPAELLAFKKSGIQQMHEMEMRKEPPERYPANIDSLGIEVVGQAHLPPNKKMPANLTAAEQQRFLAEHGVYEPLTSAQQASLQFLLVQLKETLSISASEIFRHPEVSYKNKTEAETATWK